MAKLEMLPTWAGRLNGAPEDCEAEAPLAEWVVHRQEVRAAPEPRSHQRPHPRPRRRGRTLALLLLALLIVAAGVAAGYLFTSFTA